MDARKTFYVKESLILFLKFGIKSVTISQITRHLNVSSKTLYTLFSDKTGLILACFELYKKRSEQEFEALEKEAENVAEMLVGFYNRLVETLSQVNPNFFNDIAQYFPEVWDSGEAFGIYRTKALLRRGIQEEIFVKSLDIDICAETLTLLLRSMFERDPFPIQSGNAKSSQRLLSNILWPYVRGICTPQGLVEFRKQRRFVVVL